MSYWGALREAAECIREFLAQGKGTVGCTWHQNEDSAEKLNLTEHQWFMESHSVHVASPQGAVEG